MFILLILDDLFLVDRAVPWRDVVDGFWVVDSGHVGGEDGPSAVAL